MDPYTHTVIATFCIATAFYVGKWFQDILTSRELGELHADHIARLLGKIGAKGIEIDLEEDTMVIEYADGSKEHI